MILSIIDILAGISIVFPNFLGFYLGVIVSLKGLSSSIGGLAMGETMFLILGIVDIIAGLMLIFTFNIPWFWVILILKGLYGFVIDLGS